MGNRASATAQSAGETPAAPPRAAAPKTFQVRITEGGKENPRHLHYVTPGGAPVWCDRPVDFLKDLDSFGTAQRVCREIMISPQYPPGTRVQFFQDRHRIKRSTVLKPHAGPHVTGPHAAGPHA